MARNSRSGPIPAARCGKCTGRVGASAQTRPGRLRAEAGPREARADHTAPTVSSITLVGSDLVATAYDTPDPRVPGGWANEPVTPVLLRWRIVGAQSVGAWHTAVDFREMLPQTKFHQVYTPATRQNHKGEPGRYSFYLQHGWSGRYLTAGAITVQVEASDTAGNCSISAVRLGPDV